MLHRNLAFIDRNHRGGVFILDSDVENRSPDRNDGGWRPDFVVIRLAADFFDLDFYAAEPNLQQVFPITWIIAENHA